MIYIGENSLLVTCDCGCGKTIELKTLDDQVFISVLESCFYSRQEKFHLFRDFEMLIATLKKEKIYLLDICFTKKESEMLIKGLENLKVLPGGEENKNLSSIKLGKIFDELSLCIQYKSTLKDILFSKTHRAYEIVMNKDEFDLFLKRCKKYIAKNNEDNNTEY